MKGLPLIAALVLPACSPANPETAEASARQSVVPGAVVATAAATPATGAKAAVGAVCAKDEPVLFSCNLRNGRKVAVCGALLGGRATAQYRYGKPGEPAEMIWPRSSSDSRVAFASVPYSGGGEAQLSFANGTTRYVVYSRIIRTNFAADEPNDPAIEDGVLVMQGGRQLANLACDDQPMHPVDYNVSEKFADKAEELFTLGD